MVLLVDVGGVAKLLSSASAVGRWGCSAGPQHPWVLSSGELQDAGQPWGGGSSQALQRCAFVSPDWAFCIGFLQGALEGGREPPVEGIPV